ncbi:MAG: S-layer homology domain-containing protein [Oscillospiraceae bacterium]|nr:S-layer homology domain-containing protein [Oscillospiraceae bacterium]
MKQRILSLFLALALSIGLLSAAAGTAGAADSAADWANEIIILDQIEADLITAIRAGKSSLDLQSYRLNRKTIELNEIKYYSPYVSNGIDVNGWWLADGTYLKLEITYPKDRNLSEINAYFDLLDRKVAEIDAMLAAVPDDADKVLALHDYLAYVCEYDYENLLAQTVPPESFSTAGVLINRRAVCQGFTYAFMYFMNRAGVECHRVISRPMDHAWNVVRLGNSYYHVDVTWDDPVPDDLGMVRHRFLLLSDTAVAGKRAIGDNHHHDWETLPVTCSDTQYDNAYWYGVESPILSSGSDRYYIKDGAIVKNESKRGGETALLSLGEWPVWGSGSAFWVGSFSGLYLYNGKLYYNTATELRRLDLETMADETVYAPETTDGYLYGSAVIDGEMIYEIKKSPNETGVRRSVPFHELTGEHVHSYTATVTAPTCTEQGFTTYTCECGDSYVDRYVAALGHDVVTDAAVPATCTATGLSAGEHCTRCDYMVAQKVVPMLAHSYKDGVCTACGAKDPNYKPVEQTKFNDVKENAWYYDAVNYAVRNGLMNGVGGGRFAPNEPMTRAMLVTVLWRYEGEPKEGKNTFTDVPDGQWYTQAVAWAAHNGIVGGVGSGKFDPSGNITREQMAAILYRYADKKGFDTSKRGDPSGFPDAGKVSSWAKDAIAWAVAEKIIGGSDGKLLPQGNATRAQVSTILMRFIENFVKTQAK